VIGRSRQRLWRWS